MRGGTAFFLITLVLCALLQLAYPSGIVTQETVSYHHQSLELSLFGGPGELDWWRTPGFSWVLRWSTFFAAPDRAVYALLSLLFASNIALLFLLGWRLWGAVAGAFLASLLLLLQVSSMHVYFLNRFLTSDPLYAQLSMLAALLASLGGLTKKEGMVAGGCVAMGSAMLVRAAGAAAIIVWIPWLAYRYRQRKGLLALCLGLLCAPMLALCGRNAYLYGSFAPSATARYQFIRHAHFVLREGDRVFPDAAVNQEFWKLQRRFRERLALSFASDRASRRRGWEMDQLFPWRETLRGGPFDFFERQLPSTLGPGPPRLQNSARMFEIERLLKPFVWRILCLRPREILQLTALEYSWLLRPHSVEPYWMEDLNAEPSEVYALSARYQAQQQAALAPYQREGHELMARILRWAPRQPAYRRLALAFETVGFWLTHAFALLWLWRRPPWPEAPAVLLLWGTGAGMALSTALLEVARLRYALGAEMVMQAALLLILIGAGRRWRARGGRVRKPEWEGATHAG